MRDSYYSAGSQRSAQVHSLFSNIATRYDLLNDLQSLGLHRRWKRRLVALASPQPADAVLDLCCGTGDLCLRFARCTREVTGLDFNPAMLEVARRRVATAGLRNVTFEHGDATRLPFADACFDIVTMSYGLRNLDDMQAGLREMVRVLRPGGRLLILDFGKPPNALWRTTYFGYLRCAVPVLGAVFCGDRRAYAYILESLLHYPAQEGVTAGLRELGLTQVRLQNLLAGAMSIHAASIPRSP